MPDIDQNTVNWFKKAVPNPTPKNLRVQLGCHLEELSEMFDVVDVQWYDTPFTASQWRHVGTSVRDIATALKTGNAYVAAMDPTELLDALCDQQVTGVGVAHMLGMDIELAMLKVDASNWSKFDSEGNPIFDENGKIKKGPGYFQPDLFDCLPSEARIMSVLG